MKRSLLITGLIVLGLSALVMYLHVQKIPEEREDQPEKNTKDELIRIHDPQPNESISAPLVVTGEARGNWYFEATFPVVLTDWDGKIIAESYAQAQGEWMTSEFVPFTAKVEFEKQAYGERGFLILKKDNPSGLPEFEDAIEIPILFE